VAIQEKTFTPVPKPGTKFTTSKKAKKKRFKKVRYLAISKLKDIAWKAFSRYIRAVRDAAPDQLGFSVCYTCGAVAPWPECQCGHYESRISSGTFLDERNNHSQCSSCNMWKKGNHRVYARNLVRDYGKNILDVLAELNMKPFKRTHEGWVKLILKYERKLKEAGIECPSRPAKLTVD